MSKYRPFFLFLLFLSGLTWPGFAQDVQGKGQPLFSLGVFAYESGDYEAAEGYLKKALLFDDGNAYFNYYMGKVYLETGDYSQAAVYFDKARSEDKGLPDLAYNWAYVNYMLNDFSTAEKLFDALAAAEPKNVLAHYYAGLARYNQGKYQQALQCLERAARMDTPARYNAAYYAGVCNLQLKNFDSAKTSLTLVQQNAAENSLRRSATDLLKRIQQMERESRRYSFTAKVGWEYDDNEVLEPIDNDDLYGDEEDNILSVYLSTSYDFIKTEKFVLGAGYSHYLTMHEEFKEFDISGSLFDIYARYRLKDYTFGISYNPDYYWLDSDSYLCRHEVKTTVSRQFKNLLAELSYNHQRDNNMYDSDQDGYANELFLRCEYALPEGLGSLRAGIGYEVNSADHKDYDYDLITTELAARFNLCWGFYCGLCGEHEIKRYEHANSLYGRLRDDDKYVANVLLSKDFMDGMMSAHIGYEYTKNNSNIDDAEKYNEDFEYESNAVKLFWTFKL